MPGPTGWRPLARTRAPHYPESMRVVTTTCSNTEIVCALGCADRLVGVDEHSDWPPAVVQRLPRVGKDLDIDAAKVRALAPDLVIASLTVPGHERVVARLRDAGLPVIAPEPVSLADVARDIRDIADALGEHAHGLALAARFEAALEPRPAPSRRPRILVEWWPKPVIVPGRRSWATELVHLAGGENPFGADEVKSRPLETAEIVAADPDAFVMSWCGIEPAKYRAEVVRTRPGCASLRAVRAGRIFAVPEAHLGRPGPRLVDGLEDLAHVVQAVAGAP